MFPPFSHGKDSGDLSQRIFRGSTAVALPPFSHGWDSGDLSQRISSELPPFSHAWDSGDLIMMILLVYSIKVKRRALRGKLKKKFITFKICDGGGIAQAGGICDGESY